PSRAAQLASWLTSKARKPIKPQSVLRVFQILVWLVWWVVIPVLVLPALSAIARRGWNGFRWSKPSPWHWLTIPTMLLLGLWAPLKLMGWVPRAGGFGMEAV